ncbi:MAG TPA: FAD-dependent oxidoreductase [Terriglobales bacterium]|nr:FAD-dependent oxidoreductase [Terriglobales bacterium]
MEPGPALLREDRQGPLPRPLGRGAPLLSYDLAVVGLGIVGACATYAAAKTGARVIALDPAPGAGTSRTSFAWINANRKEPEAYHRLNAEGMAAHRDLVRELGDGLGHHAGGSLEWATGAEASAELRARVQRLAQRAYAASSVTRDRALTLEPGLAIPPDVREVAFYGDEAWLDAPRAVRTLLDAATTRGAEVRLGAVTVRREGQRVVAVAAEGPIDARAVLLCVGPVTQAFLAPLGVMMPVDQVYGLLAVTSPVSAPLTRVVHAPGVHLRGDAGGGLLLGADDLDGPMVREATPAGRAEIAARMLERAAGVFPAAEKAEIVEIRVGARPMPGDGHTIAGRLPGLENGWMIATHSGVTLGPLLGRLLADEIAHDRSSALLEPFRPARFLRA